MRKRIAKYVGLPLIQIYWKVWKPKSTGCKAIVIHDGKILLVKNLNKKYWSLPGGGKKKKETPEVGLLRELKEELAIIPSIKHKLGEYDARKEKKRDTVHVFVTTMDTPDFRKQWEIADAQWFSLDSFPQEINAGEKRRITEYLEGHKEITKEW